MTRSPQSVPDRQLTLPDVHVPSVDYVLTTTRAVRKRLDLTRAVDPGVVDECIGIAMQAPAGSNLAAMHWVVITDPSRRELVASQYRAGISDREHPGFRQYLETNAAHFAQLDPNRRASMVTSVQHLIEHIHEVPVLVIPCYAVSPPSDAHLFVWANLFASALPAVWSLQLALRSRGLVSALTTAHLLRAPEVAEALGISDGTTQVGLVPVAYPLGTEFRPAHRAPLTDIVHRNGW
jgi:nitroreductase